MEYYLTGKRAEVLKLRSSGKANKEISSALGISDEAVRLRLKGACEALEARDVSHAITIFIRQELLTRIKATGMEETFRGYLLQETGSDTLDGSANLDDIIDIINFVDSQLQDITHD